MTARIGPQARRSLVPGEPIVITRGPGEALRVWSEVPFKCGRSLLFAAGFTHTIQDGSLLTFEALGQRSGDMHIEHRPTIQHTTQKAEPT